jgi:hypothetical protein
MMAALLSCMPVLFAFWHVSMLRQCLRLSIMCTHGVHVEHGDSGASEVGA